jgi:zinc-ribbon domain
MSFCNSCGTALEPGVKFCAKCGAPSHASSTTPAFPASVPASATPAQSGSTLKTVLIIVGVLFALFVLGTTAVVFVGMRIARHTRVENSGDNVRVESPFGTIKSTTNPEDITRELGTTFYPGAIIEKGNASSVDLGGMRTVAAQFETDDPEDKVAAFYKKKFPEGNVSVATEDHYTIVSSANHKLITINIEPDGPRTRIHIASVTGKRIGGGSSD